MGGHSPPFHFHFPPFPFPLLPCREVTPRKPARGVGSAVRSPSGVRGKAPAANASWLDRKIAEDLVIRLLVHFSRQDTTHDAIKHDPTRPDSTNYDSSDCMTLLAA